MADAYSSGGGGGVVRTVTENTRYGLDKPYDFDGGWGPDQIGQLNEMLTYLFRNVSKGESNHLDLVDSVTTLENAEPASDGELLRTDFTLSQAELLAMTGTPKELIAAPGSGIIVVVRTVTVKTTVTVQETTSAPNYRVRYAGLSSPDLVAAISSNISSPIGGSPYWRVSDQTDGASLISTSGDPENRAVQVNLSAALTDGRASATGSIWYSLWTVA